ncbi:Trypsin-like peptidase domain protein [Mycena venus]|uniref:Trypsin-like peptidase domain protein n=1 Tax=Mycena venus TaxID=2733690 RepID=A0A8H6X5R8_9AGAR|nr:Trypsin-like peptidase domain protein [Mycena venus]
MPIFKDFEPKEVQDGAVPPTLRNDLSKSIGMLVLKKNLTKNGNTYVFNAAPSLDKHLRSLHPGATGVDSKIDFLTQQSLGFGTAFVVANSIMGTAGNIVMTDQRISEDIVEGNGFYVVFDYQVRNGHPLTSFSLDQVREVVLDGILIARRGELPDYCFFRTTEAIKTPYNLPLPLVGSQTLAANTNLATAGFPLGLPMKYSAGQMRAYDDKNANFYYAASVDNGCAGSPIFAVGPNNAVSSQVIGIARRGHTPSYNVDVKSKQVVRGTGDATKKLQWEEAQRVDAIRWAVDQTAAVTLLLTFKHVDPHPMAATVVVTCNGKDGKPLALGQVDVPPVLPATPISCNITGKLPSGLLPIELRKISFQVKDAKTPSDAIRLTSLKLQIGNPRVPTEFVSRSRENYGIPGTALPLTIEFPQVDVNVNAVVSQPSPRK